MSVPGAFYPFFLYSTIVSTYWRLRLHSCFSYNFSPFQYATQFACCCHIKVYLWPDSYFCFLAPNVSLAKIMCARVQFTTLSQNFYVDQRSLQQGWAVLVKWNSVYTMLVIIFKKKKDLLQPLRTYNAAE